MFLDARQTTAAGVDEIVLAASLTAGNVAGREDGEVINVRRGRECRVGKMRRDGAEAHAKQQREDAAIDERGCADSPGVGMRGGAVAGGNG